MRLRLEILLVPPLLAACSAGGSATPPQVVPGVMSSQVVPPASSSQALPEAAAADVAAGAPLAASGADDLLYVGNTGNNSVTVYWHAAVGNTAPRYVIAGSNTGINNPGQLTADAANNLYVLSRGVFGSGTANAGAAILVFAHGANGNVAPIRRIAGPLTGLHNPQAMTVDRATGQIFVFDNVYNSEGESSMLRFAANANGNVAPLARSAEGEQPAVQLASDSTGKNIIEAFYPPCCNSANTGVQTLSKQFANNALPATLFSVGIMQSYGLADDPTTKTYVAVMRDSNHFQKSLYRFAEKTDGHGPYMGEPAVFSPPIVSIVTSEQCGTQVAVAPGPNPYTYVIHAAADGCPADAVYVYANNANGNAAPLRVLGGSATRMSYPYGIYEGP